MSPGLISGVDAGRAEFLECDAALGFQADIDDGEFVGEADDAPGNDGAVEAGIAAKGFIEERGEIVTSEMILHRDRGNNAGDSRG